MPNPKGGLIWIMTAMSLLGLSKANAQESSKWPDNHRFLKTILANTSNLRIDTVYVADEFDIDTQQAFTNAKTNEIIIKYFYPGISRHEYEKKYPPLTGNTQMGPNIRQKMAAADELVSFDQLLREIELMNNNIPTAIVHELQHRKNRVFYSDGFDFRQTALFDIFDEVSARVAELLFCRDLFLENRNMAEAFLGPQSRKESKVFTDDWSAGAKSYAKWLRENPQISKIPSKNEISRIIRTAALDILAHDWKNYVQPMSMLLTYQIRKKSNKIPQKVDSAKFSGILSSLCSFCDVNFLDECGADTAKEIMEFANSAADMLEKQILAQQMQTSKTRE
ncbi:MAG: hypothetical protein LBD50_02240 [Rickettsiales bacterium]|jgi:hypothetical protein|nr:hypothetical protein [Rickettsiales bacterium]